MVTQNQMNTFNSGSISMLKGKHGMTEGDLVPECRGSLVFKANVTCHINIGRKSTSQYVQKSYLTKFKFTIKLKQT